ncbi:MAG: sprE [Chitinophagaceae bacterium]|nr:sprE [Chitinophagaceae bacterium]
MFFPAKYHFLKHRGTTLLAWGMLATIAMWLTSCTQNSNSRVAITYHNLLARDNAFFLARERMKDVEKQVYAQRTDNFNEVLNVIPPFDSTKTKAITPLDDIIKKASMPIRRHKNSVYVDDSYVLVGRCRMYKADFKLGMETYKFVNHTTKDNEVKAEAMIYLMRAYMAQNEWDNAFTVSEYISEKLKPRLRKNKREFYLTRAQYYRHFEQYDKCAENLTLALPQIRKKDPKSRTHFILGQIYQDKGIDSLAYKNYRKVLKLNPAYEFSFYTRLYMTQVGHFNKKDKKTVDKYFKNLLSDDKNLEYKDKIYYEMAKYEIKQKNYTKGEEYFKKALQNKGSNKYQTATSYLALGELYFDKLNNYKLAKIYYDSAVINWDPKDKRYKEISKRQKILTELSEQTDIIQRNDSLLALAAMDTVALNKFIDKAIARDIAEAKRKADEEKKRKKKQEDGDFTFTGLPIDANASPTATFYFSNTAQVSDGYTKFTQTWGKRKLEDNWRRSRKETPMEFKNDTSSTSDTSKVAGKAFDEDDEKADTVQAPKIDRNAYTKNIPFTADAKLKANTEVKDAMYKLGKIYDFKLYLKDSTIKTFKTQIKRYPENDHEPEELYLMYLIAKEKPDAKLLASTSKDLHSNYPNSPYTKLIDNPNYLIENKTNSKKAAGLYKEAYKLYNVKDTLSVDSLIASYYTTYTDGTSIDDKFAMLKILNQLNKKGNRKPLADSLDLFIEDYKTSNLVSYAETIRDQITGKKTDKTKDALKTLPPKEDAPKDTPQGNIPLSPLEEKGKSPDGLLNPPADTK